MGTNWSGCDNGGVPENGDSLTFSAGASNVAMNNDLSVEFADITFSLGGSGYSVSGNDLVMSGALNMFSSADMISVIRFKNSVGQASLNIQLSTPTFPGGIDLDVSGTGYVNFFISNSNFTLPQITGTTPLLYLSGNPGSSSVYNSNPTPATFVANSIVIDRSTVSCNVANCLGDSANVVSVRFGEVAKAAALKFNLSSLVFANPIILDNNNIGLPATLWAAEGVTLSNTVSVVNDSQFKITAPISGVGSIITSADVNIAAGKILSVNGTGSYTDSDWSVGSGLSGTGDVEITGIGAYLNSTSPLFSGKITLHAGALLTAGANQSLGNTTGATYVEDGAALRYAAGIAGTISENISLAGDGLNTEPYYNIGSFYNEGDDITLAGDITLSSGATLNSSSLSGGNIILDGAISGTGGLYLVKGNAAAGYFQMTGADVNTYTGGTHVNGASLVLSRTAGGVSVPGDLDVYATVSYPAAIEAQDTGANNIADNSHVTLQDNGANTAKFYSNSIPEVVGGMAGNGEIVFGGAGTGLTVGGGNITSNFTGNFSASGGRIVKVGTGTWNINGVTYSSGPITPIEIRVEDGTLVFNSSLPTTDVTVTNNGVLSSVGPAGDTIATAGGKIRPLACLTVSSLTMAAGGVYNPDISGTTACSDYDKVIVTGTADLNGGVLNLGMTYGTPTVGDTFTILTAGSVVGTFNGLPNGSTIAIGSVTYRINYTATTVVVTVETSPFGSPAPVSGGSGAGLVYVPSSALDPRLMLTTAASSTGVNTPGVVTGSCVNKFTTHTSFGKTGAAVTLLQSFLNEREGAKLPVTGYFGSLTRAAVKAFQTKYGIQYVTGNQYELTTQKLNEISCK